MPRPEIVFDKEAHTYLVNGTPVPSVTTVIKATVPVPFAAGAWYGYKMGVESARLRVEEALLGEPVAPTGDATRFYDQVKGSQLHPNSNVKQAQVRGNFVHEWIEEFSKSDNEPAWTIPPDYLPRIEALKKWLDENEPQFHEAEIRTASETYGYAGTLDAFVTFWAGEFKGMTARIDYKTGKRIYPDQYFPQLEAYEQAEVECGQPESDMRLCIHIPESGKVVAKRMAIYTFRDFELLLNCYNRQQYIKDA